MQKEKCIRGNKAVASKLCKKRRFKPKFQLTYENASESLMDEYWDSFIHAEIYLMEILGLSKARAEEDRSLCSRRERKKKRQQQTYYKIDQIMLELLQLLKEIQEKKISPEYIWGNDPKGFCKRFLEQREIKLPTPLELVALRLRELAKGFLIVSCIILLTMNGAPTFTTKADLSVCLIDPIRILVDYLLIERHIKANIFHPDIKGKTIYRKFMRYDFIVIAGLILINLGAQKLFDYPHSYVWFTLLQGCVFYLLPILVLLLLLKGWNRNVKHSSQE
ncbi:hypothetical protein [Lachnoclostridium phytofermentans]|uniref:Uncharacterized protein n=1 Tax=Lachnoclostridium phytofermentans (strain ATCC 700394 / DSM 18823 / ISDg) TaxID=357809 RepID=A9KJ47_LACP7|nr:hypothetical protein [Lachnoclostridium phytofermentans]ABX41046.1 hypothetical protein Cphy_0659 [Lachnoclostridium phytofermentans ISDg]